MKQPDEGRRTMAWIDRLTVKQKLLLLSGAFAVGFIVYAVFAYQTRALVQVNGPYHEPIKRARELLTVISPSTLDLGESRLTVFRLWAAGDRTEREELIQQGKTLREAYDKAHEQWSALLPEGALKQKLIVDSYRPAVAYFDARDQRFIPALMAGDRPRAQKLLDEVMRPMFLEHRAALTDAIRLARENLAAEDERVANLIASR